MMNPLPSVNQVYSMLIQEEKQREIHNACKFNVDSAAALSTSVNGTGRSSQQSFTKPFSFSQSSFKYQGAPENRRNVICNHCKKPGHVASRCYHLIGFPKEFNFTKGPKVAATATFQNALEPVSAESQNRGEKGPELTRAEYNQIMHILGKVQLHDTNDENSTEASNMMSNYAKMELSLIGLQNSGKTSLVNVVATGGYNEDVIPTVGFNMKKVTKGNVKIKLWDLGGQTRFRSMWERYCRDVSAIVYVVDAADDKNISISRSELHDLLSKPSLTAIPLLVLGNKIDQPFALSKDALTHQMDLKSITDREVCCFMISCKNSTNIDAVIDWLVKHSKSKS